MVGMVLDSLPLPFFLCAASFLEVLTRAEGQGGMNHGAQSVLLHKA